MVRTMRNPDQARVDAAFGAWMRERRNAMKPERWTQERLAKEIAATGLAVTRNWIVQLEAGAHAGPELSAAIQRLLGPAPQAAAMPVSMEALVEQISALVEELRLSRQEQERWNRGVERVLEAALAIEQPRGRRGPRPLVGAER